MAGYHLSSLMAFFHVPDDLFQSLYLILIHTREPVSYPRYHGFEAIFERVNDQCDLFWLENLNLRGGFKKTIMDYIAGKYPDLVPLYDEIYNKHNRSYFEALEVKAEEMAKKYDCPFVDNEMPYGRVPQGHPVIVDYFYHEEIRGTENTGKRNR